MATIELNDDTLYTSALPAGARLFGAQSAAATEPTSFGREAIYNYVSAALAPVASSGSATDLTSGTLPLGRLHAWLADISSIASPATNDVIYFNGTDFVSGPVAGVTVGALAAANNLSDVASAATARTNLGLAIGTNVQAWDAQLDSLSGASANGVSLVTAADYAAMRALLDLEAGTDFLSPAAIAAAYQPLDATLTALAGVTVAADKLVYATGADTFSTTDFTSVARTLVNQTTQALMRTAGLGLSSNGSSLVAAADYAAMKALLDLEIGTDVQAYNARLADIAGASWAQGDVVYYNGSNLVRLAAGTNGHFLKTQGAGANPTWAAASGSGAVATDAIWDAKGDLAVGTGADTASRLAVGTNGQVLTADSGEATGLKWATVSGTGDVTAASTFGTDNVLVKSDGTSKGVQSTGISVDDSNNVSAVVNFGQTGYHDLAEISSPSSPSANIARIYAVDSQSKTVPFFKDSAGVASALDIRSGWVQMYRTSDAGADPSASPATWVVRAPDGSYVTTSGTTTQGTQEAFTYCATNGYNLFINGGAGINTSDIDVATIHSTSGIDVAPMFKQAFVARGVTFNFGGSATYGFKLDSMMMAMWDTRSCQVVVGTSTYETGVWLRPRTANAVDPAIAITASDLLFGSIVHGKSTSVGLLIDPTEGPILDGVFIEVHEPNGKGSSGSDTAAYGVRILDHATNVVKGTTMRILDAHGHGTAAVAIGSSTTNGANIHSNHFDIHCDPGASSIGLDVYGAYNTIVARINDDEGTATTGINLRSSAVYNHIIAGRIEATTKIADASAGFTNVIENESIRYGGAWYLGTLSSISTVAGSGGAVASRIQFHSTGADSAVTTWRWSADAAGPRVIMSKSRGASVGTQTVVQSGDVLGEIVGAGSDGTDMEPAASIRIEVDGTPGAGDMPGKIVFSTTADGAEAVTDRFIINAAGKMLAGVASAQTMGNGGSINPTFQLFGASATASFGVIRETTPGGGGALFALGSSRSTPSTASYSALQSGDGIGSLVGVGDNGTNMHASGAAVVMSADGNWNGTDAPGRVVFQTTPTGSLGPPSERMRIDSKGNVVINTAAISTSATDGFLYVPSCAGTPTGTPTTHTGMVPIVVNTSAHKLYFYSGGSWRDAGP